MKTNACSAIALLLFLLLAAAACDCGDDDDDSGGGHADDDGAADDDAADDDAADDDATDDDDDDDNDSGPPIVDCIPPLDYDGDGDTELLLSVSGPADGQYRLFLVEPGTFERGEPALEYNVGDLYVKFDTADFDGNGVWDIVAMTSEADKAEPGAVYDVYLNGDFSAPAHTFGPYDGSGADALFIDVDGNGLPEMFIVVQGNSKAVQRVYQLIDADHDFAAGPTFAAPDGGNLRLAPEKRVGVVWPTVGTLSGKKDSRELLAYSVYTAGLAVYLKAYAFDATDGSVLAESDAYYLGDQEMNCRAVGADVDGDGRTEAVIGVTEYIADPESRTGRYYILGGADLATEWASDSLADEQAVISADADFNLDGVIDPLLSTFGDGLTTRTALDGPAGYAEMYSYDSSATAMRNAIARQGRGRVGFGYDFRGWGPELLLFEMVTDGGQKTGFLRSIDVSDGSLSGNLLDYDLAESGNVSGNVLDLGRDGTLDLVVLFTERYWNGVDYTVIHYVEMMAAPNFYEWLHEQLADGYNYNLQTYFDLTGDASPDLVIRREDTTTHHDDYLLYACDSAGCEAAVEVDYGADESFYFIGPML